MTLRFAVENGQKTIWGSCANVIFIRNAGTNPKVMAVRSKANVNRKNLIMPLADSCFEFLRDLEKKHYPDLVLRRAAEFAEDVRSGAYPDKAHLVGIDETELNAFLSDLEWV